MEGANNIIGGTTAADRNIISGNQGLPLDPTAEPTARASSSQAAVRPPTSSEGNYIGTDVTGMNPLANIGDGIEINNGASGNTIGGSTTGAGNLISGNDEPAASGTGSDRRRR